jgi:predicted O-methyltransferase YrrM
MNARGLAEKFGMLSVGEVDLLQTLVKQLPPDPVIVNIGANIGTGSVAFLEARPDAFILSIDKRPCPDELKHVHEAGLETKRCIRILAKSQFVGQFWPWMVDMVFVDGDHSDNAVRGDIVAWRPMIKQGGFMIFHDYKHPNLPRLTPIVDRMMRGYPVVGEERYMIAYQMETP